MDWERRKPALGQLVLDAALHAGAALPCLENDGDFTVGVIGASALQTPERYFVATVLMQSWIEGQ